MVQDSLQILYYNVLYIYIYLYRISPDSSVQIGILNVSNGSFDQTS